MSEDFADSIAEQVDSLGIEQLLELCTQFAVTVPDSKKGKLGAVKRLLMKHVDEQLVADNEDVLREIDGAMGKMLKPKAVKNANRNSSGTGTVTGTVKNEESDGDDQDASGVAKTSVKPKSSTSTSVSKSATDFLRGVKLREFKIDGTVGRAAGCIDWQNLQFQIKKGRTAGHIDEEIMNGVIKAMKAGTSLHRYYQNNVDDMSWDGFFDMLESHYICKTQGSSKVFTNMDASSQEPDEEAGDFAFRLLEMAKMVLKLGEKEEGSSWDPTFVRKTCLQALSTGFNDSSIRADLREFLKDHTKTDGEIIDEVGRAEKRSAELKKKMKGKSAASNALYRDNSTDGNNRNGSTQPAAGNDGPVLAAVQRLSEKVDTIGQVVTRVDALEIGLANVQQQLSGLANVKQQHLQNQQQPPPIIPAVGGRRGIKCDNCEANRVRFCRHCSKCGEEGHKRRNCPN